ncbi:MULTISPECIES: hypothetical protein [unclassified Bacillus (in: firmicutes)]|uniref:hypothetical protein n=1 Tax=unclassified Bacillus (in: firmicutes) TaxID=185979 RepID=UPI001BED02F3|nr:MULTISPECIES: hypothetical protein [unclassified Bacillus (in: firmicutes)]MBT2615317.1 hypothetical protein [Bacillus sp. ISL-78]MBT2628069.1 hypothetical protein [Bacillus sp. ISL-101]
MQAYLIGTVLQWVSLAGMLVWIGLGIYQFTEIKKRKKVLTDYDKSLNDYSERYLNDKE